MPERVFQTLNFNCREQRLGVRMTFPVYLPARLLDERAELLMVVNFTVIDDHKSPRGGEFRLMAGL